MENRLVVTRREGSWSVDKMDRANYMVIDGNQACVSDHFVVCMDIEL